MTHSDALSGNVSGDVGVKCPLVTGSHLWRMKYLRTRKKSFVKFQTSNAYLKKKRSADKKLKNNKNKLPQIFRHPMEQT
jgi:hypothetical protein